METREVILRLHQEYVSDLQRMLSEHEPGTRLHTVIEKLLKIANAEPITEEEMNFL